MQNLRTVGQTVGLQVGAGKQLDLHHFTILNGDVYCYGGQGPTPVGVGGPPRGGKDVNSDGVRLLHTKAEVAAFRRAVPALFCILPIGVVRGVVESSQPCNVWANRGVDHAHVIASQGTRRHEADHCRLSNGIAAGDRRSVLRVRPRLIVPQLPATAHIDSQFALNVVSHLPHAIVGEVPEKKRSWLITRPATLHWRAFVHEVRRSLACSQNAWVALTQRGVVHSACGRQEGHGGEIKGPGWTNMGLDRSVSVI